MVTLKNAKIGKSGDHRFFTVPKKLIESGVLDEEDRFTLEIKPEKHESVEVLP